MSICVVLCVIVRCWTGDRHENERDAHISTAHGHQLHARPHACPRKNVDKCTWVRLTVAASEHELRENIQWVPVRFARQSVRPASSQVRMYMQCPLTDRACMSGREDGRRSGRRFIKIVHRTCAVPRRRYDGAMVVRGGDWRERRRHVPHGETAAANTFPCRALLPVY